MLDKRAHRMRMTVFVWASGWNHMKRPILHRTDGPASIAFSSASTPADKRDVEVEWHENGRLTDPERGINSLLIKEDRVWKRRFEPINPQFLHCLSAPAEVYEHDDGRRIVEWRRYGKEHRDRGPAAISWNLNDDKPPEYHYANRGDWRRMRPVEVLDRIRGRNLI